MIDFTYYYFNIFITFCILFIIAFSIVSSKTKAGGFYDRLSQKVTLFIGFFLVLGIFLTYSIFRVNYDNIKREATLKSTEKWIKVLGDLQQNDHKCPRFVNSLNFSWQKQAFTGGSQQEESKSTYPSFSMQNESSSGQDDWATVNWLSIAMFQVIEDFLVSAGQDVTTYDTWISNFLHWTNSPLLFKVWKNQSSNFDTTTVELIDLLFYHSQNHPVKNETELRKLASDICKNPQFLEIFKKKEGEKMSKFNNIFG